MTTAAILLAKDELDIIESTIRHLHTQVDEILVQDNASADGTRELLEALKREGLIALLLDDPDPAYYQSRKTSALADIARQRRHDWVLPVDADEWWQTEPNGRPIREHLLSIAPDVPVVDARLFHYMPTSEDDAAEPDPYRRIQWRLAAASSLPKVACRLWQGLEIEAGNHGALYSGNRPRLRAGGLRVNHFSWRSESQYAKKISNGARAYAATDLPEGVGAHWRMWGDVDAPDLEERAAAHFRQWFFTEHPPMAPGSSDLKSLFFDPVYEEGE